MSLWQTVLSEFILDNSLVICICYFLTLVLIHFLSLKDKGLRVIGMMVLLHLFLVPVAALVRFYDAESYTEIRFACLVFGAMALISMGCMVLFRVFLLKLNIHTPRILQDLIIAGSTTLIFFMLASRSGFNVSGLIATSAVLTVVLGFALQDTLGNIMGGLALQMDNSIQLGDWVVIDEVHSGRVIDIRWRYTAIETRNWETIFMPNSALMKGKVVVQGRRTGKPIQLRRWIYFNVDFRYSPNEVIRVVLDALHSASIENIAKDPPINCILREITDSFAHYAVRYWLTELAADDPTDSEVRIWIYFALKRAGIPLALPAHALFVTQESSDRKARKNENEIKHRIEVLARIDLFKNLPEDSLELLAVRVHNAPFTEGEIITRQGAEAHWLYIIQSGTVSVNVAHGGLESEVARLNAGNYFGEMSLMTGDMRSATVIALTDVTCYRLDKEAFKEIVQQKPDIAEQIANILAKRRTELEIIRENLEHEDQTHKNEEKKADILSKIINFLGFNEK
jgi:small-conductance mechanosensitive channel/CRP-like cAMP-binding protein